VDLAENLEEVAWLTALVERTLPSLEAVPVRTERCFYDCTPDEDFVVDRVGPVAVGAGTSGHGFKFALLLGRMLADLADGGVPEVPLDRFRLGRFKS
jgi:sarcosine oxidase